MAEKKKSSKGENPGSLLVALIVIAAVLAIFFYSSGINLGNVFNTVRYRASDLGPRLVECVTSPSNCKLTNNYNVTPNGFESQSSNSSSSNNNSDQSNTNSENKTNSESNNSQSSTNNSQNSNSESGINNLASAKMSKTDALNELNSIPIVASYNKAKYKRTEWKHWISYETPCWTTREEVLDRQAEKGSITYLDKDDKETKDKSKACSIKSGVWIDPYSKEKVEDPTKLDIDHTGALSWTAKAGGQEWDKQKKQDYANDFDHLVATTAKENRTKGDKGPSEWMPESSKCEYAKVYTHIVKKYKLNLNKADKDTLEKALNSCAF
jgi:hypothetical protein